MERKLIANPIVPDGEVWVSPKTWDDPFTKGKVAGISTSTNKTHEEICEYIYVEDSDSWDSKCGYNIEDEHTCRRAKFCQYCGRKLHHA